MVFVKLISVGSFFGSVLSSGFGDDVGTERRGDFSERAMGRLGDGLTERRSALRDQKTECQFISLVSLG